MATTARLFVKLNEEDKKRLHTKYVSIIVYWGHPSGIGGIGNILVTKYKDYNSVMNKLISTGGIYSINKKGINLYTGNNRKIAEEFGDSTDYHRFLVGCLNNLQREYGINNSVDYAYLFDNGKWYIKEDNIGRWKELKFNEKDEELRKKIANKERQQKKQDAKYDKWCNENKDFLKRFMSENASKQSTTKSTLVLFEMSGLFW